MSFRSCRLGQAEQKAWNGLTERALRAQGEFYACSTFVAAAARKFNTRCFRRRRRLGMDTLVRSRSSVAAVTTKFHRCCLSLLGLFFLLPLQMHTRCCRRYDAFSSVVAVVFFSTAEGNVRQLHQRQALPWKPFLIQGNYVAYK